MWMNTDDHYGLVTRVLHWLIAVLVAGMLAGGVALSLLPDGGLRSLVIAGHKSVGVLVLLLMLTRVAWRSANPSPRPLGANPVFNYFAHVLHVVLYVLLIVQPLSGILMSQAFGYPVVAFGLLTLPPLVWPSASLGSVFNHVHTATAIWLAVTVGLHTAAALKHHYIDGDRTLMRMLTGR